MSLFCLFCLFGSTSRAAPMKKEKEKSTLMRVGSLCNQKQSGLQKSHHAKRKNRSRLSREPLYPARGLPDNAKQASEDTHALTLVPVCSFGPSQLL